MMETAALKELLSGYAKKVFFCGIPEQGSCPVIYASDAKTCSHLSNVFSDKAKTAPYYAGIKVKKTSSLRLEKTRSLEDMLERLPHHEILFDPTATIERAKILVCIAKQTRQLGAIIKGCYFNSEKRNVHFHINKAAQSVDLTAIRDLIEPILLHNTQRLSIPFSYSITLSFQKPQGKVIAIDKASIIKGSIMSAVKSSFKKLKWPLLVASASSTLGMTGTANASLPAVSETNGWLGLMAGGFHNQKQGGAGVVGDATLATPLGHYFGAQGHVDYGSIAHNSIVSVDGYLFWRDPALGLLGPHVTYTSTDNVYTTLYGGHAEAYVENVTLSGEGGGAHQNIRNWSGYGEATVRWYAKPDWQIYAGYSRLEGDNGGELGTEYQLGLSSLPGLSVFADLGDGSHSLRYAFLGLRYYFGENKSLIRRHREDNVLPSLDLMFMGHHRNIMSPRFHS